MVDTPRKIHLTKQKDLHSLFPASLWNGVLFQGESQIWLRVGNCFFDLLLLLQSYSVACLGNPAPLLDCKLKCFCSAPGEIVCPAHLWIEEVNTPFPRAGHSLGDVFRETENPFTLLPHWISLSILPFDFSSSLLLSLWHKRTWHPDPNKMVILSSVTFLQKEAMRN